MMDSHGQAHVATIVLKSSCINNERFLLFVQASQAPTTYGGSFKAFVIAPQQWLHILFMVLTKVLPAPGSDSHTAPRSSFVGPAD